MKLDKFQIFWIPEGILITTHLTTTDVYGRTRGKADDALRNHVLSEAVAFISDLPYGYEPIVDQGGATAWLVQLGNDFYDISTADIIAVRDQIAAAAGLEDVKEDL